MAGTKGATVSKNKDLVAFGREVRRRRTAIGLSLEALSEVSGLTPKHLRGIEAGRRNPSLLSMLAIARGLDVPLGEMLGLPRIPAEAIEAWRLLCSLPTDARLAMVSNMRALVAG
jgi:transcriptional regulator with XRE-family HTH domain